jgi:glutamyl/glutaminyl-tRNA synthetase
MIAKATGGQFLLRIEDTDQVTSLSPIRDKADPSQKRTVRDAEERLYRDLEWAGIEWDEGWGLRIKLLSFTDSVRSRYRGSVRTIQASISPPLATSTFPVLIHTSLNG